MRSVGLDLGAREVAYCEVAGSEVVARRTVRSVDTLRDMLGKGTAPARVAIEACREAWHVHDVLTEWGHEVLLVDTTRARQIGIGQHGRKTDRLDAEALARAVERGAIPLAHVLSPARRRLRDELAVRRLLVETRAQYVTTIRGIARAQGERLPGCDTAHFVRTVRRAKLKDRTRELNEPLVVALVTIDVQLAVVECRVEALCRTEPVIAKLTTVPGVGTVVAAMFVSVVDEARRFRHAHELESYLGLVPCEDTSGGRQRRRLGAITKRGNSYLRALLAQAAHVLLRVRGDDPLKRWGNGVVKRRGRRIAVVALARRLAGVLWAMWRRSEVYDPERVGFASGRGIERHAQDRQLEARAMQLAARKEARRRHRFAPKLENNDPHTERQEV